MKTSPTPLMENFTIEELTRRLYDTLGYCEFYVLKIDGNSITPEEHLEKHEKEWPKWRGDLKQVAKRMLAGKL